MEARRRLVGLDELKERAAAAAPALDAWAALGGPSASRDELKVIAEIKRRSPSKGDLASIVDPAALAVQYADGGASVISVLTEQRRFNGSLADLDAVRAAVDIPLLRKDFTVDEYQIWEARAHGADLILLIVAALSDAQLREFSALSHELGMNVLVETHTPEEIERAAAARGADHRRERPQPQDARRRPLPVCLARRKHSGRERLSWPSPASRNADDVAHYAGNGAHAILVGEALVSDATPRERISEFKAAGAAAIAVRT